MSDAAFDELRERLAEITDLSRTQALLGWDQQVLMPVRGAADARRAARDASRASRTRSSRRPRSGGCSTSSRRSSEQHDYDSFEASLVRVTRARLGEGAQGARRAARRDVARRVARPAGLGRGAQEQRLRRLPARRCARTSTCGSATSSASTATTTSRTTSLLDDYEPQMKTADGPARSSTT